MVTQRIMRFRLRRFLRGLVPIALALVILAGCVAPQEEDLISIIEQKQMQGEAIIKTMQANNCGGTQEMKQDMQAVHQYNHDIEVVPEPGVTVNRKAVMDEIRTYYNIPNGPSDAVCVVPVQIPAGVFYSYDIEWVEVWREGIFEIGEADGSEEGTYRFRQSMLCEVVSQRTETCTP